MPGRSEMVPALSRLGLDGFTPIEPPDGAGTAGGTVDGRGFGWLSDGTGTRFAVARGIAFLSKGGSNGDPALP